MTDVSVGMLVNNGFTHDSRVQRQAAALAAAGYEVTVIAASCAPHSRDGYNVVGVRPAAKPGPKGVSPTWRGRLMGPHPALRRTAQRMLTSPERFVFSREARKKLIELRVNIVHCHDLDTLTAGASAAQQLNAALVYDSHEIWTEQDTGMIAAANLINRAIYSAIESRLIKRAAAVIVTSEGHGDFLARRYGVTPHVVRNTPSENRATGCDLRNELGITATVLLYVGLLTRNRGLEESVQALASLPDTHLVLMGPDGGAAASLQQLATRTGVERRVHFKAAVPKDEITAWAATADAALILIPPNVLSHSLCLPNKLFECAFAGVPIIAIDLPIIGKWVRKHSLGTLISSAEPSAIADAARRIAAGKVPTQSDAERYDFVREFAWERESQRLISIYKQLSR